MRKNILNTKSGNLEMSQCLHYTPRSKTYCGKGRINNEVFSKSLLIVWISHENKCFNHQPPLPTPATTTTKNWCHITPLPPSPWWSPTYNRISPPSQGGCRSCNMSSTCTSCLQATISYFLLIKAVVAEVVLINLTRYIMSSITYYHTLPSTSSTFLTSESYFCLK